MGTAGWVALAAVVVVAVVTIVIGSLGVRVARTTDDFLAASRTVGTRANAAAISGQYLSAASFLGVAGIVLKDGVDGLWYPVGFTAGYLALLFFVAAPLRRSGAYTVPDFAEVRLDSTLLRTVTTWFVVLIGWLYLLPQLQAAGLALTVLTTAPTWVGVVAVGLVVTASVTFGGMRSMTFVQAFQYWLKLTALAVPALVLVSVFVLGPTRSSEPPPPVFTDATTVEVSTPVTLQVTAPVEIGVRGEVDETTVNGPVSWAPGPHTVEAGTVLRFPPGAAVPVVSDGDADASSWSAPLTGGNEDGHPLLATYSLGLALLLGTMGLPHVLVRFYTNPDGRAARRTTVVVLAMLGGFYLLPVLLGAMSRFYVPELLVTGQTDAAILLLPTAALPGWAGIALGALVAAGAFAAFLSTSSGLLLSVAGVLSTDLLPRRLGDFRIAAHVGGAVPIVAALGAIRLDFSLTVSLAFALAASTFCPLLVLGIWWKGLTDRGATVGMLVGGGLAVLAIGSTLAGLDPGGWVGVLLARPALVTVPLAFLVMVLVSRSSPHRVPANTGRTLLRLHAPERLGLGDARRGSRPSD
ncbi:cation acetate symporter [Actinomycetospora cinnamomea]|uniref:Sodium:solute symporter family protein n=1 Tax=Actinomycetospora cinnamomea TaxID=663609 RepID=A0A2U1FBQ2_9PSEU|nr:cation acetate symporter [Actinomycetospora cinnamomea]PVZ09612.1 sodium:solute symporter family protein [Actinomycetospora cinnamomea]